MPGENDYKKYFLIGSAVFSVLVVGAIAWAFSFQPNEEAGLSFNDANDPSFGPSDAMVVIRQFSDYECPACKIAEEGVFFVKQTYGDKVRFVWNDYPLARHTSSLSAAYAARCAEEQGKFWEYHDLLFARQEEWTKADVTSFDQYARDVSLDMDAFTVCVSTKRYQKKVNDDAIEGTDNKIMATPTFFINNKRFEGAISKDVWKAQIEEALKP